MTWTISFVVLEELVGEEGNHDCLIPNTRCKAKLKSQENLGFNLMLVSQFVACVWTE